MVSDMTKDIIKKLDNYCKSLSNMGYLNGSVLVANEGSILLSKGYGMANFEFEIDNSPQTIYRIGSITKQFTAAAILLLQESNVINTNDVVSRFLHDYPRGDEITIHHLLTHTSGIPNFTSLKDYRKTMKLPMILEETIHVFKDLPLGFEPGEKFEYSNSGYSLLSYIIETVTNKTLESFLQEKIFNVLGMMNTGFDNNKTIIKNRASGYEVWGETVNAEYIDMSVPSGAGAMYSTTEDLYIWNLAMQSKKILNKASSALMMKTNMGNYGYGVFVYEEEINKLTRKVTGHGGGINGFLSEYRCYINEDITVIVLSNISTTQVGKIANALAKIALKEEVGLPKLYSKIDMELKQCERLIGDYKMENIPNTTLEVTNQLGKLYLSDNNTFKFEICPFSHEGESMGFFTHGMQGTATFTKNEMYVELFGISEIAVKL